MLGSTLYGTNPHAVLLATSTTLVNRGNPFSALNPVFFLAPGTPTIYGVNRVPKQILQTNNQGNYGIGATGKPRYQRIIADGVATTWTSTDYPSLINAHNDAGALTNANRLISTLVVNGIATTRVQSDATPVASQWKISLSGGVYTLTAKSAANGAYAAGTVLEVFMADAADVITQGPLVAGTLIEGRAYDFMVATAPVAMHADRV